MRLTEKQRVDVQDVGRERWNRANERLTVALRGDVRRFEHVRRLYVTRVRAGDAPGRGLRHAYAVELDALDAQIRQYPGAAHLIVERLWNEVQQPYTAAELAVLRDIGEISRAEFDEGMAALTATKEA